MARCGACGVFSCFNPRLGGHGAKGMPVFSVTYVTYYGPFYSSCMQYESFRSACFILIFMFFNTVLIGGWPVCSRSIGCACMHFVIVLDTTRFVLDVTCAAVGISAGDLSRAFLWHGFARRLCGVSISTHTLLLTFSACWLYMYACYLKSISCITLWRFSFYGRTYGYADAAQTQS